MRIRWIDSWRGLLISQIVLFHVLGVFINNTTGQVQDLLNVIAKFIEHYHVSSFVVLSGFCWHQKKRFLSFAISRILRLLVPYFLFGSIWALLMTFGVRRFISENTEYLELLNGVGSYWYQFFLSVVFCNGYPNGLGFRVINVLWFLPAFCISSLLFYFIDKYGSSATRKWIMVFIIFAAWLKVRWLQLPWGCSEVPKFLILLLVGKELVRRAISALNHRKSSYAWSMIIMLIALLCIPDGIYNICACMGCEKWNVFFYALAGSILTALIAQRVDSKMLSRIGCASLGILVLHKFVIIAIQCVPALLKAMAGMNTVVVLLSIMIISMAVIVISWLVFVFLERICPYIVGESKRTVLQ